MNSKNQSGPGFTATQPNSLLPEAGSTEFYSPVDGPDKDHLCEDISPNPKFECDGGESTNSGPAKWCPVSREAAEVIWNSLQIDANKIALDNEIEKLWVVGQHGGRPVAVLLWKNGFLGAVSLVWEKLNVKSLPAVSLKCGSSSIRGALASVFPGCCTDSIFCPPYQIMELEAALRVSFVVNATRPLPASKLLVAYDPLGPTLCLGRASWVARKSFKLAMRMVHPKDPTRFANEWAAAALDYVTGGTANSALLTLKGMAELDLIRCRNVHKIKDDLVARRKLLKDRLRQEMGQLQSNEQLMAPEKTRYFKASVKVCEAFNTAIDQALERVAVNHKPFSQRFIKGLVLAEASGGTLHIGTLSDSISGYLAACYDADLMEMQNTEIIFTGPGSPELWIELLRDFGIGSFCVSDGKGNLLSSPRIYLRSDIMIYDHRAVFHEFRHAAQETACIGPIEQFACASYEESFHEVDAITEEIYMISKFGILF